MIHVAILRVKGVKDNTRTIKKILRCYPLSVYSCRSKDISRKITTILENHRDKNVLLIPAYVTTYSTKERILNVIEGYNDYSYSILYLSRTEDLKNGIFSPMILSKWFVNELLDDEECSDRGDFFTAISLKIGSDASHHYDYHCGYTKTCLFVNDTSINSNNSSSSDSSDSSSDSSDSEDEECPVSPLIRKSPRIPRTGLTRFFSAVIVVAVLLVVMWAIFYIGPRG
jgi:hypothetical protein